jgi:hypothetical protein
MTVEVRHKRPTSNRPTARSDPAKKHAQLLMLGLSKLQTGNRAHRNLMQLDLYNGNEDGCMNSTTRPRSFDTCFCFCFFAWWRRSLIEFTRSASGADADRPCRFSDSPQLLSCWLAHEVKILIHQPVTNCKTRFVAP